MLTLEEIVSELETALIAFALMTHIVPLFILDSIASALHHIFTVLVSKILSLRAEEQSDV